VAGGEGASAAIQCCETASPLEGEVDGALAGGWGVMVPPSPRTVRISLWGSTPHPSTLRVADLPLKGGGDFEGMARDV
jgi:hypothetical protein